MLFAQKPPIVNSPTHSIALGKMIAMLILLVIGGTALVIWAWLTLRTGRRTLRRRTADMLANSPAGSTKFAGDDWARKPLYPDMGSDPEPEGSEDGDDAQ